MVITWCVCVCVVQEVVFGKGMSARRSSKGKQLATGGMKRAPASDLVTSVHLTKVELVFV